MSHDIDVGVQADQRALGRLRLELPDPVIGMQDLALQVGAIDDVEVDDSESAHPGRRKVIGRRRTQTTGADDA